MTAPVATYRVQLQPAFTFDDAAAIAPYLARLGVSHLYCSPYLQAAPGSTHGYDVVDPERINAELGGADGHRRLTAALAAAGLGHILDVVPNHMAALPRYNPWWWDVLEHGRDGPYASYFDIDWGPPERRMRGVILLPVLGDRYGVVLGSGELRIVEHDGGHALAYHDHLFPLAPGSLDGIDVSRAERDPALLHEVLERQHYRLAYWRSDRELNYRRFFDVNELIALRMERKDVFEDVHALPLRLMREGRLQGLRIDHVDGLADPLAYLRRLRAAAGSDAPIYVEKILAAHEHLRDDWPVEGDTGYGFARLATGVLVDPDGEEPLDALYRSFTGTSDTFADIALAAKRGVMRDVLGADLARLAETLLGICDAEPAYRDHTREEIRTAIEELIAGLDVYRTYVRPGAGHADPEDVDAIEAAAGRAAQRGRAEPLLLRLLADILCLRHRTEACDGFVVRLQQTSGAVMAKAIEDTAFYAYNRFVALNEVGGEPQTFGVPVAELHRHNAWVQSRRPLTLLATSTHDCKRGEDVRARLAVLSEIPERWSEAVWRWAALNERHRSAGLPDRDGEYLLYQTLVGAWPLEPERAVAYMAKATKEAGTHTSWTEPDPAFDAALESFVRGVLADDAFVSDLEGFVAGIRDAGWVNSLTQTLLKLASPGVPDIYQGSELVNLSLVDPDNRRPVDHGAAAALLEEVLAGTPEEAWGQRDRGAAKLLLTARALALRGRRSHAFGPAASYAPLAASGPRAGHVIAFARGDAVIAVAPRLVLRLGGGWDGTTLDLPPGAWTDVICGTRASGRVALEHLLARFPVALLEKEEA